MKDITKELVDIIKSGGTLVNEETRLKRLKVCEGCPFLSNNYKRKESTIHNLLKKIGLNFDYGNRQCVSCLCFVDIKTATKTHPLNAFDFDCPRWERPYRFLKGITTLIKHSITGTENVTKCPKKYW